MDKEELIENLSDDILAYVMHGKLSTEFVSSRLSSDPEQKYEDFDYLLDLHFVLKEDVTDFVQDLDKHLRRIKTQTKNVSRTRRGAVDGRINWSQTIKKRHSINPDDRSLFVCDNRTENYDIDENLVLIKLLKIVQKTLNDAEKQEDLKQNYDWVGERWDQELIDELHRTLERNVHLNRIRDLEDFEPTDRMISRTKESRQKLYRKAARLLEDWKKVRDGDREELQKLLRDTAITPDDEETLLELYTLFRFISTLESMDAGDLTLKTVRSGKQQVARFNGDKEIYIYHDNSGPDDLSFLYSLEDEDGKVRRPDRVQEITKTVVEKYFDQETYENTGRPDVLVIEIRDGEDQEYIIVEVKNSKRKKTIRKGIRETIEYLAYLKKGTGFVLDEEEGIYGSEYNGLLVTQDHEGGIEFEEQEGQPIKILKAGELNEDNYLEKILEENLY